MIPSELERVYDAWRKRDEVQLKKAICRARLQEVTRERNRDLEARRVKLYNLLESEKISYEKACREKMQAEEIAHKKAIIADAASVKDLIKAQRAEVAQREYNRLFRMSDDAYRICRPKVNQREIVKDRMAICCFTEQQKAYEKSRHEFLINQGDGFSRHLTEGDAIRKQKQAISNKEHQNYLLQQISACEEKRKLLELEKIEDLKKLDEDLKLEAELQRQAELKSIETKQETRKCLQDQMNMARKKLEDHRTGYETFDRSVTIDWGRDIPLTMGSRERLQRMNQKALYFLKHQQQIRDHRRYMEGEAEKRLEEMAERSRVEHMEREKAFNCLKQKWNRETLEEHRTAAMQKARKIAQEKAKRLAVERDELLKYQMRLEEDKRAEKALKDAKRSEFRASLWEQIQQVRLRRQQEADEKQREGEVQRREDEAYQERIKSLDCYDESRINLKLHPWRRMAQENGC